MHIKVIKGARETGKTRQLRQIEEQRNAQGKTTSIIHADAYAQEGLLSIMEVRIERGERTLLVDDCTRQQIDEVLKWQTAHDENDGLKDLEIFLVRIAG
ncbi:hypothetical protein [Pseudomonas protegens]|uniref:hypothetical protein n=1 Tax=Pseudomonas protegens TaxID=380021 RepID=UPI000F482DB9|nr:hypothetical protein [Pseudomonas protegens]ROL88018.1 hypothetical protein BK639_21430 [Pseudomonas protegens]ROL94713.1 hypothetical protein BK640_30750 [Pseudomonas protegens]ROM04036.1 hypothetical protein BK642_20195 [Pseudomonas protegens]ROM05790.1 hypothetical protein BK641_13455 [Pseudomonas protegens]